MPREGSSEPPWNPRAPHSAFSPSPSSPRLAVAPSAFGSSAAHVTTVELRSTGAQSFGTPRRASRASRSPASPGAGPGRSCSARAQPAVAGAPGGRAAPEDEDGPDVGSPERRLRRLADWATRGGSATSNGIEARAVGRVSRVRAHLVWSPDDSASRSGCPRRRRLPPIVPRLSWGADESIRRGPPSYAADVRFAIVHHTAGRNDYTRAEARRDREGDPALPRAGERLERHRLQLSRRPLRHDLRGPVRRSRPERHRRARAGLQHRLRGNRAARDVRQHGAVAGRPRTRSRGSSPGGSISRTSIRRPSSRTSRAAASATRAGSRSLLSAVSGHRDTGFTECPGNALYARLGRDRGVRPRRSAGRRSSSRRPRRAARRSACGRGCRASQPWTVAITTLGRRRGRSADRARARPSTGPGIRPARRRAPTRGRSAPGSARPATGTLRAGGGAAPLAIESARRRARGDQPERRRAGGHDAVTYRDHPRPRTSRSRSPTRSGASWRPSSTACGREPDSTSVTVDGAALADGDYNVVVTARTAAGVSVQKLIPLSVNRTLGLVDGRAGGLLPERRRAQGHAWRIRYTLAAPAVVRIRIEREGRWVASPLVGSLRACDARLHVGRAARVRCCCATGRTSRSSRRRAGSASSRTASRSSPTPSRRASASSPEGRAGRGERAVDADVRHRRAVAAARGPEGRDRPDPVERACRAGPRRRVGRCRERQRSRRAHPARRLAAGAGQ